MSKLFFSVIIGALLTGSGSAQSTNLTQEAIWAQNVINTYKSIQEQHQVTMRAVQQAREEAEANAKKRTEALEARLNQLENTVVQTATAQVKREEATRADSRRFTITVVGAGFLVLVIVVVLLIRFVARRQPTTFAMQPVSPLGGGVNSLATLDPAQESSARLHSSLDRLEKRLSELEATAPESLALPKADGAAPLAKQMTDLSSRVALLLGKGQALLNLQQADTALGCFDEIIALDPNNAEAFVKKGAALEKLSRLDEAIECYDRAIQVDQTMTMAYLCKGGVFNRLERYGEAVQCYEQALRAQQHPVG